MNILQVSQFYPPHTGGIERVAQQLSKGLTNRGHSVTSLSAVRRGFGKSEVQNDVSIHRTSSLGTMLSVPISPALPYRLSRLTRQHDLVHYHLPHPFATISHLVSVPSDVPVVATYHSDIVRQERIATIYKPVLKRFLTSTNQIITTTPTLAEKSEILSDYSQKCDVIPLTVNTDEYNEYNGPDYDLGIDSDTPVLLFVGRLVYYKGLEYLIDAMTDVDAVLLIAGAGELRKQLEQQVIEKNLSDKIKFLGYVTEEELDYCYKRANIFVLPSSEPSEAFGIVQLEAMLRGIPVINTELDSGVPWVSKDGETGITVPPKNSDALARAISELIEDGAKRNRYGRNARSRVTNKFDEEKMIIKTERLYHRLLGR